MFRLFVLCGLAIENIGVERLHGASLMQRRSLLSITIIACKDKLLIWTQYRHFDQGRGALRPY